MTLLGLIVHIDPILIEIDADPRGGILGGLLCALAGLLDLDPAPLGIIVDLLNIIIDVLNLSPVIACSAAPLMAGKVTLSPPPNPAGPEELGGEVA